MNKVYISVKTRNNYLDQWINQVQLKLNTRFNLQILKKQHY